MSTRKLSGILVILFAVSCVPSITPAHGKTGEFSIPPVLPLSESQVDHLRKLVKSDHEAAKIAEEVKQEALPLLGIEPQPLEVIHYEGLVNTNPKRIACVKKLKQTGDASRLMRYWQVSGDTQAAKTLKKLIIAWAKTYKPDGNDVNENKFHPFLIAYLALREQFNLGEREAVDAWVETLGKLHLRGVKQSRHFTNRYCKHIRLLTFCGRILERDEWLEEAHKGIKRYVTRSLYKDGSSLDFKRRDTLTYHCSALRPVLELAIVAGDRGKQLYTWESPKGGSLKKSVDFVIPYSLGEKTHKEWVHTKVDLDRRRAAAGIEKYRTGRLFEPYASIQLMECASFFDPSLMRVVRHLHGGTDTRFPTWQTLMNAVARNAD